MAGVVFHAQLQLLDHQIISRRDGRLIAKVDDLDLHIAPDGAYVSHLLTGPAALGPRFPGLLGKAVTSIHRRLHPDRAPQPNAIPAGRIVEITSAVLIDSDEDLHVQGFGEWVDEQIISRIPGARREAE